MHRLCPISGLDWNFFLICLDRSTQRENFFFRLRRNATKNFRLPGQGPQAAGSNADSDTAVALPPGGKTSSSCRQFWPRASAGTSEDPRSMDTSTVEAQSISIDPEAFGAVEKMALLWPSLGRTLNVMIWLARKEVLRRSAVTPALSIPARSFRRCTMFRTITQALGSRLKVSLARRSTGSTRPCRRPRARRAQDEGLNLRLRNMAATGLTPASAATGGDARERARVLAARVGRRDGRCANSRRILAISSRLAAAGRSLRIHSDPCIGPSRTSVASYKSAREHSVIPLYLAQTVSATARSGDADPFTFPVSSNCFVDRTRIFLFCSLIEGNKQGCGTRRPAR